jgi:hypothetical protein
MVDLGEDREIFTGGPGSPVDERDLTILKLHLPLFDSSDA